MDARPYHAIFFDVGGTLLRPSPSVGAIYAEVAARYGIEADPREVERRARGFFLESKRRGEGDASPHVGTLDDARRWWRRVVRESFGEAGGHPRFEAFFGEVFEEFARPRRYAPFPEVEPLLADLARVGHRLGVISNWDERLRPVLEGLGLAGRFETIVISAEVGSQKPDRAIYDIARERIGAPPGARLLQVGDSVSDDVEGARAAGFEGRHIDRASGADLRAVLSDLLPS